MRFSVFLLIFATCFAPANVMAEREADILPTPKTTQLSGNKFVLNVNRKSAAVIVVDRNDRKSVIAAQEINDRIKSLGGELLPMVTAADVASGRTPGMNAIRLLAAAEGRSVAIPGELRSTLDAMSAKGEQGYAIQFHEEQQNGMTAYLAGVGWQGMLHAGSTFRLLIRRDGAMIYAAEAQIVDWPDFKSRGLPVWPLPGSFDEFKKYVDWAFRYKFNRIYTAATRQSSADGFNLATYEERRYLKKINAYAKERGILINYALDWAVGSRSSGGNNEDFKGSVLFNDHYFSWSEDRLLQKRAREIAKFAGEVGAASLLLHCIDTYEENWDNRGGKDRERYGNDRSAADANVINIFTQEIRKVNPGIELQFVTYPYHVNFDLAGNGHYNAWMKRLTAQIPKDIHLVVAELNRDQADSWVAITRQPLVHWVNGNAFQWGRYFSTLPAFTKSSWYAGRDRDIVVHMEPIGYFNGEVMQLVAAEYEWNVNAPGSGYITEEEGGKTGAAGGNLHFRPETVNGENVNSWGWYHGTVDPQPTAGELLLKACRLEFGQPVAPYLADFFRNNPVGWRSVSLFANIQQNVVPGREPDASRDQLEKTDRALASLNKALLAAGDDVLLRKRINNLVNNAYRQKLVISAADASGRARQLMMRGLVPDAGQEIKQGRDRLSLTRREMEKNGYWSDESRQWYAEGERRLSLAAAGMEKNSSRNLINNSGFEERRNSGAIDRQAMPSWSAVGTAKLTSDSHGGAYAANLQLKPSEAYVFMEQPFAVPAGCEAYVEFWLKKEGDFRVIPIIQYWNEDLSKKEEVVVTEDFPFNAVVENYWQYNGKVRLPSHVRQAVFKIYADWFGRTPMQEKMLSLDDVFVGCGVN